MNGPEGHGDQEQIHEYGGKCVARGQGCVVLAGNPKQGAQQRWPQHEAVAQSEELRVDQQHRDDEDGTSDGRARIPDFGKQGYAREQGYDPCPPLDWDASAKNPEKWQDQVACQRDLAGGIQGSGPMPGCGCEEDSGQGAEGIEAVDPVQGFPQRKRFK